MEWSNGEKQFDGSRPTVRPNDDPADQSRRQLLLSLPFIAGALGYGTRVLQSRTIPPPPEKYLTSGDQFQTPVGPVTIDGWRIMIPKSGLDQYLGLLPRRGRTLEFVTTEYSGLFSNRLLLENEHVIEGDSATSPNDNNTFVLYALPRYDSHRETDEPTHLIFTETEGSSLFHSHLWHIKPRYWTDSSSGAKTPFYSEVEMSQSQLGRIGSNLLPFYDYFAMNPTAYIMNDGPTASEKADEKIHIRSTDNYVVFPASIFQDPKLTNDIDLIIYLAMGRKMMDEERFRTGVIAANETRIYQLDEPQVNAGPENTSTYYIPSYQLSENHLYFASDYDPSIPLFPRLLTILRFFPQIFLERFGRLPESDKKAVAKDIDAFFLVLECLHSTVYTDGPRVLLPIAELSEIRRIRSQAGSSNTQ